MPLRHDGKEIDRDSKEASRLINWRIYESFDIPTKRIIDELSRFVQDPYFNEDQEKIWLYRALRRILEFEVKINRKLRKLTNSNHEINILKAKLDMYRKVNWNEERDNAIKKFNERNLILEQLVYLLDKPPLSRTLDQVKEISKLKKQLEGLLS